MKLYRPVLIESAERAEALPAGTLAWIDVIGGPARYSAVKTPAGDWYIGGREYHGNSEMTRWTALVPVEAAEVRSEDYGSYHLVEALTATAPFTVYVPQEDQ